LSPYNKSSELVIMVQVRGNLNLLNIHAPPFSSFFNATQRYKWTMET